RDTWRSLRKLRVGDLKELVETRGAVVMQCAGEVGQFLAAVLAFAVFRVAIEHGGGWVARVGVLLTRIDPTPARPVLLFPRCRDHTQRVHASDNPSSSS